MEIKHKASIFIALVIGGVFFVWLSVGIMWSMGVFHILMAILAVLGGGISFFGIHGFLNRGHNLIIINEHGITQIQGESGGQIHVTDIELIKPFAKLRGRGVTIILKNGESVDFDCRHYCSVKKFIKYCKLANLPCA